MKAEGRRGSAIQTMIMYDIFFTKNPPHHTVKHEICSKSLNQLARPLVEHRAVRTPSLELVSGVAGR